MSEPISHDATPDATPTSATPRDDGAASPPVPPGPTRASAAADRPVAASHASRPTDPHDIVEEHAEDAARAGADRDVIPDDALHRSSDDAHGPGGEWIGDYRAFADAIGGRMAAGRRARVARGFYPVSAAPPYGIERWFADLGTGAFVAPAPAGTRVRLLGCGFKLRWRADGTRAVVRRIYDEVVAGQSLLAVARGLAADGVVAPGQRPEEARDGRWTAAAVGRIVSHPIYAGDFTYGRATLLRRGLPPVDGASGVVDDAGPLLCRDFLPDPPVTRATWRAAQAVRARRGRRGGPRPTSP